MWVIHYIIIALMYLSPYCMQVLILLQVTMPVFGVNALSKERHDMTKTWSQTIGARTIQENEQLSKEPRSRKRFNVSREPFFPTIPLTNIVIDNLHLFLRVFDVLMRLHIDEFKRPRCDCSS